MQAYEAVTSSHVMYYLLSMFVVHLPTLFVVVPILPLLYLFYHEEWIGLALHERFAA